MKAQRGDEASSQDQPQTEPAENPAGEFSGALASSHSTPEQQDAARALLRAAQTSQVLVSQPQASQELTSPASKALITLSTASLYPLRAQHTFEAASELGYDGVEVMIWSDPITQDADELRRLTLSWEVPIRSLHAPCLVISQTVWGRDPAAKLRRTVQMANYLEVPTVVVHPPFVWQTRYALQFEEQVHELTDEYGVTVAVENMYPWRPGSRSNRAFMAYRPGWDPTTFDYDALTLDLSHAAVARQRGMDLVNKFESRLRHLHLADGAGSPLDEHLVPGRGRMDCAEVLQHLAITGWDGDVCLEISTRQAHTPEERRADLEASLHFARAHLQAAPSSYKPPRPAHRRKHENAW